VGVDLRGASLNLDGGCDAVCHRQRICKAGMIPIITEHLRHRNATTRGRQRLCNAAIHA